MMKILAILLQCFLTVLSQIHDCQDAAFGEFNWQGSLQVRSGTSWFHICGAVLYSPNKALAAAHCLYSSASSYRVGFGIRGINNADENEQYSLINNYNIHPDYNGNVAGYPNDIAVLVFTDNMDVSGSTVGTVPLASGDEMYAGHNCVMTGWGTACGVSDILQKTNMTVLYNYDCDIRLGAAGDINDGHICIFEADKPACSIDSGGPMVCGNRLAGIASWGIQPCSGINPFVYTRISFFNSWIGNQ